jgi:hypothetical protein
MQDEEQDSTATGPASGTRTREPFAYYDPATSSWKTCQGSLLEGSGESCTTWPKQGTWEHGFAYELPTSAHPIYANASSSSPETTPLLPTPGANDSTGGDHETTRDGGPGLRGIRHLLPTLLDAIRLLPTPTTQDAHNTNGPSQQQRNSQPLNVAINHGDNTSLPCADGNKPSAGPPPAQLTIADA